MWRNSRLSLKAECFHHLGRAKSLMSIPRRSCRGEQSGTEPTWCNPGEAGSWRDPWDGVCVPSQVTSIRCKQGNNTFLSQIQLIRRGWGWVNSGHIQVAHTCPSRGTFAAGIKGAPGTPGWQPAPCFLLGLVEGGDGSIWMRLGSRRWSECSGNSPEPGHGIKHPPKSTKTFLIPWHRSWPMLRLPSGHCSGHCKGQGVWPYRQDHSVGCFEGSGRR